MKFGLVQVGVYHSDMGIRITMWKQIAGGAGRASVGVERVGVSTKRDSVGVYSGELSERLEVLTPKRVEDKR